jgi:alkanesulfonate monooxygenase SsuD/methylene tetrahydromethanopterin reductase-like flavin-dependent oxidoreductase (luciferase family)
MVSINDCGLVLEPQLGMRFQEIIDWAKYAERNGYGYIFRSDHLLPTQGKKDRDSPECWVTLGALASATERVKFGPMVSPIGFRNPALLAQMACNLHAYSHGRFVLGVGAGWYREEYLAKGFDFSDIQVRHGQLTEALKIIRPLTEGKRVDFRGKHYRANTVCYPYPRSRMRLVLGGWSPFIRRAAKKYADEWNLWNGTPMDFRKIKQQVKNRGRRIELSRAGLFFLAETSKKLQRKLNSESRRLKELNLPTRIHALKKHEVLCGDTDEFISQLNEFAEAGVNKFYFNILNPDDKHMIDLLTKTLANQP